MLTKIILLFMGAMGMPNNDLKSAILSLIIAALYFCAIIQHMKDSTQINRFWMRLTISWYFYAIQRFIFNRSPNSSRAHSLSCNPLFSVPLTVRVPFIRINNAEFDARRQACAFYLCLAPASDISGCAAINHNHSLNCLWGAKRLKAELEQLFGRPTPLLQLQSHIKYKINK